LGFRDIACGGIDARRARVSRTELGGLEMFGDMFQIVPALLKIARSILDGYFNPLVFWYQWEYLLISKDYFFAGYLRLVNHLFPMFTLLTSSIQSPQL
jgi:hypothetical protein